MHYHGRRPRLKWSIESKDPSGRSKSLPREDGADIHGREQAATAKTDLGNLTPLRRVP